jgi:hypothetical protein
MLLVKIVRKNAIAFTLSVASNAKPSAKTIPSGTTMSEK